MTRSILTGQQHIILEEPIGIALLHLQPAIFLIIHIGYWIRLKTNVFAENEKKDKQTTKREQKEIAKQQQKKYLYINNKKETEINGQRPSIGRERAR